MKSFIIEQKITAFVNRYSVFAVNKDGDKSDLVAFAEQKRLAFKEEFTIYTAEDKKDVLFSVKARQVFDFGARYDIRDETGTATIAVSGKKFGASLLRSTWQIYNVDDEQIPVLIVRERSLPIAIFRRIWELIPYIGDIPFFAKYHFDFIDAKSEKVNGSFIKTTRFRDHYLLQLDDSLMKKFDERAYIAQAIMLDALQSR